MVSKFSKVSKVSKVSNASKVRYLRLSLRAQGVADSALAARAKVCTWARFRDVSGCEGF